MQAARISYDSHWHVPPTEWLYVAAVVGLLVIAHLSGLRDLVTIWDTQEEYSFGYMIPFVSAYLIWQRRDLVAVTPFQGSWFGTVVVAVALVLGTIGELATLGTLVQYSFLLCVFGVALAYCGWSGIRVIAAPLAILVFMVPLPNYFLREMSAVLQLLSSQLGVFFIRAFDISVHLEGNVIDLGSLKLQVVEACSGLRYLIPLMTLGFIAAYAFQAAWWKRALVFASTVPITLLMNSIRIGIIGVLVEFHGKTMAEGFLHDFEGWVVFMVCTAILLLEIVLLARLGGVKRRFQEVFSFEPETQVERRGPAQVRRMGTPFFAAAGLILIAAVAGQAVSIPVLEPPTRKPFADFPWSMGGWNGQSRSLDVDVLRALKLDDYLLADFRGSGDERVNLYVSYYATQANGNSAHSPRACIPGDGWEIAEFGTRRVPGVEAYGRPLDVNRAVIQKGQNRQIVYYWFQQRGRIETDEYRVKLGIFWDALTRHRSDGAMVRLVTPLWPGESEAVAYSRLDMFASLVLPALKAHIPD